MKITFKQLFQAYLSIALKFIRRYWLLILLFILYCGIFSVFLPEIPSCIVKLVFKFPCPWCGITRSYLALFKLDIALAFFYHPLFWLLPIIAFVLIFSERPKINKIFKSKLFWVGSVVLVMVVYIFRMIHYFPNEPMEPNLLGIQEILKRIKELIFN